MWYIFLDIYGNAQKCILYVIPGVGVEPTTTRLKVWRSTTELAGRIATGMISSRREVVRRFELRILDSKSRVLTITLHHLQNAHGNRTRIITL